MFVDPCIIVQFLKKTQQDATVYQIFFIISYFKWSSACLGGHTAHHQETKTAQAASVLHNTVERCRTCSCWTFSGSVRYLTTSNVQQPSTVLCKTRGCLCSFRLLMMDGVSRETCWASFKIRDNKILINCCILLGFPVRIELLMYRICFVKSPILK